MTQSLSEPTEPSTPAIAASDRRGSPIEIAVVFGLSVGLWVVLWVLKGKFISFDFGQARLLRTLSAEAILVGVLWPWLATRGWSFRTIAGQPEPVDVWRGFWLAVLAYFAYYVSAYTWVVFVPGSYEAMRVANAYGNAAAWVVALTAIVNPVVEEFLWLGYGITAFRRYGPRTAGVISIVLRLSVHLYQGRLALISILPLGVVFTVYYVRTKRLWPVVVAHVLGDTLGLLSVVR